MRIAVDINHPGHVHFFKHFVWEMEKRGHKVFLSAIEKELSYRLLNHYRFKYLRLGRHRPYPLSKLFTLPGLDLKLFSGVKPFRPDILMGLAAIRASHASFFLKKPCISFDDTEHASEQIALYRPFSSAILTPSCFTKYLGPKHIKYDGYHELAYLHPNRFKPDPSVLEELGVEKGEKYAIIRFVSWGASHDVIHGGFSQRDRSRLVKEIARYATPLITSEGELPREFRKYRIRISPHRIHDAMAYASLYIGEGATMASEAAVLGTPAIYVNPLNMGYIADEKRYHLLYHTGLNIRKAIKRVDTCLQTKEAEWQARRAKLLKDKIDVTALMVWFVENYPESRAKMLEDPEYSRRFCLQL
ncbi:MAG: DUF354 domain-containing protein [Thermoplasmata archaeon]|nr:DUF354 domain-containing protein [Thermoplasmata archaeon]